ncbi:MAG: AEC family transporter [Anaerolineae bacterium]
MTSLPSIFFTIIAPILTVAGLGFLADRLFTIDTRTISRLTLYFFSPSLVFAGLAGSSLQANEIGQITTFATASLAAITALGWIASRLLRLDRRTASAFVLSIALVNAGNYGLPLNEFAFGRAGLERALIFFSVAAVFANTIGVFLASRGNASIRQSALNVFRTPLPYATLLGLVVNQGWLPMPEPVLRVTDLLGRAAIPLLLLLLGIQLSRTSLRGNLTVILAAASLRLVGSILLAIPLTSLMGLIGVTRQTVIIEASMPTAVISIVLAVEFNSDAETVSSIVLVSTLASVVTLSGLLLYLM